MAVSYVFEPRADHRPGADKFVYYSSTPIFAPEDEPDALKPATLKIWAEVFEHNGTILAWDNGDGTLSDHHALNYQRKG